MVFEIPDQLNSGLHKVVRPRFHYEAFWKGYDGCKDIVKDCWQTDEYLQSDQVWIFQQRVSRMVNALFDWSSHEFGGRRRKIESMVKKLRRLKQNFDHFTNGVQIRELENKIDGMLHDEEMYWKQRLRV